MAAQNARNRGDFSFVCGFSAERGSFGSQPERTKSPGAHQPGPLGLRPACPYPRRTPHRSRGDESGTHARERLLRPHFPAGRAAVGIPGSGRISIPSRRRKPGPQLPERLRAHRGLYAEPLPSGKPPVRGLSGNRHRNQRRRTGWRERAGRGVYVRQRAERGGLILYFGWFGPRKSIGELGKAPADMAGGVFFLKGGFFCTFPPQYFFSALCSPLALREWRTSPCRKFAAIIPINIMATATMTDPKYGKTAV